jgi:hypothetical protein
MNDFILITAVTLAVLLAASLMFWHLKRSRELLERWADDNRYQIVESSYRHLLRGPFFWTSSKGQTVYRVTVRDAKGVERSGWVRCGSWWTGLFSDKVEVRWEETGP